MAIIYSYPKVTTPLATDVLVLTDTTLVKGGKRKNQTKSLALSDLASYVVSSTSAITGGGTLNKIPLWTPDGLKLGDSIITQAASGQGVTVTGGLDVTEDLNVTGSTELFGSLTVEGVTTFNADVECNNNVTVQGVFAADGNSVFSGSLTIDEQLIDGTGSSGTAGQVLSSTGTGVEWINSTNANTTYDLSGAVSNTNEFAISLSGSDGTLDKVNLIPGTNITLTDNGSNGVTIDSSASALTAESIVQPIIADGALVKGDPVYITGFNNGQNKNIVAKADSSDPAKMPVVGISDGAYANNGAGFMTAFGSFNGAFDTTGGAENWSVGDTIYVKPGGGLTNIKPGGTDLVQNIAIVSRVQQNTGELEVIALGRTNDVPNLPTGRLFVGTATNTSSASDVVYVDDANNRVGIRTAFPQVAFHVDGAIRVRGDLQVSQQNNNTFVGENMPDLTAITGSNNTALGDSVMPGAISASSNTGIGALSLNAFIAGNNNTAVGTNSMKLSNGSSFNTALGSASLSSATLGQGNTAIGFSALGEKTTSNFNTAVGINSLGGITVGFRNTAIGNDAGRLIADGVTSNSTGKNSVFIGDSAKANADNQTNQIVIGVGAVGNGANTATIGNTATTALHVGGNNAGIVLKSPNGTAYTIRVTDAGALVVT